MDRNASPSERDAEMISSKASKAEFAKDYDQAFRLYIKAAESYLHLSRSSIATDKCKQQWKTSAAKALERAEKIKKFVEISRSNAKTGNSPSQTLAPDLRLTPVGIDHFSPQEQFYILKKGGTVNGLFFPMWDDPVQVTRSSNPVYSDPDGQPTLSPEQEKISPIWRRPNSNSSIEPTIARPHRRILPQQILQHIVTDCSVCASISVCLEHGLRFNSTLESSIHDSFELQKGRTSNGVSGRYDVRILFNGTWRRVLIDDRLPFHPTEGTLMCMSVLPPDDATTPAETLWPSLLEKAYMKLMGGYDFPGSNSSIDLHAFAGWIPEHVDLKGSTFEREKTWERIKKGFSSGQCVVTLGTGPTPYARWRDIPLLPSHSYAVIDADETEDRRIFTVLDPWVHPTGDQDETSRELQIPWSDVLNTFDGVYLSWDPNIWQKPLIFHGMWKRSGGDEGGTRHARIEFSCEGRSDEEIWVLLTRHVVDTHRMSDFVALRVDMEDDLMPGTSFLENQRTLSSKGTYTNSTHILTRTRIPTSQRSGILCISASYDGDAREVGFTLTAYAKDRTKVSWIDNKSIPPYTTTVEGSFTSNSAGGNCTYPTFMVNPQYQLTVGAQNKRFGSEANGGTSKATVTLNLQTNKDIPVNVAMVWSQGQRVSELSAKDLVATSGAYNYGLARVTKTITPGEYVVVASAFEPHHIGSFSLKIDSSHPFDLKPIPREGAGMYCKVVRGAWYVDGETAAGAPSFNKYSKNPIFELDVPSTTQLNRNRIRLQTLHPSTAIALNVTVYPNHENDIATSLKRQRHVVTSGAYDDTIAGVATPQSTISAGKYYIVPSTYNPGTEAGFRMLVYSSTSGVKVTATGKFCG
ncbi:hypothetical protein BDZ97DRAFT_1702205 [Flammula alnicola]|nr:hypothetical protein BDZ97DRAFT_1702205 [Flammula alnicola]